MSSKSISFKSKKINNELLTCGQLERKLSHKVQAFYHANLGHLPSKVICQFFASKLAIVIENSITNAEQILIDEGKTDLANKVRVNLYDAIQLKLKQSN